MRLGYQGKISLDTILARTGSAAVQRPPEQLGPISLKFSGQRRGRGSLRGTAKQGTDIMQAVRRLSLERRQREVTTARPADHQVSPHTRLSPSLCPLMVALC